MPRYYLAWAKDERIREKGANGGFVTATLVSALETGFIDAALVVEKKSVYEGIPVLTSNPEVVKECAGSLHGAPINLTKYVVDYGAKKRIGLPTKPCDARGIIEQAKRRQVNLDNIFMIGLNCGGTLHPLRMREMAADFFGFDPDAVVKEEIKEGKICLVSKEEGMGEKEKWMKIDALEQKGYGRRDACKSCVTKIPTSADLACGNWGSNDTQKTFVEVLTEKGEAILKNAIESGYVEIEEAPGEGIEKRKQIEAGMQKLAEDWKERMDEVSALSRSERLEFYVDALKNCIGCGACKEVCPVCACEAGAKCLDMNDARDSYVVSMYNMLRIFHLMDSCIGCGECEDVCPVDIPLTLIHRRFSERMQRHLGYTPGMDVKERPPLYETELRWSVEE
ncbi:MAG: Coenzyme F420 hydrogenase/dehydrogenase, beta subunit C-terminal domain [Methanophagales archaeon]|nr:Coenzyme F420 hydrogenase/dehydrogenase, beta subunit C-terminal domain [Methanophagales archaeon]